jgi:hypothetical protein
MFGSIVLKQFQSAVILPIIILCLQDCMASSISIAYIVKPEKFWEKQKTSVGSSKYKFEVQLIFKL